jgi:hypothetical protein
LIACDRGEDEQAQVAALYLHGADVRWIRTLWIDPA